MEDNEQKLSEIFDMDSGENGTQKRRFSRSQKIILWVAVSVITAVLFLSGFLLGVNTGAKVSNAEYSFLLQSRELQEVMAYIKTNYYKEVDDNTLLAYAARGMVDSLDPYSRAVTLDDAISNSAGSDYKVGVTVDSSIAGEFCLNWVVKDSPADKAGLKIGDKIAAVGYSADKLFGIEGRYIETLSAILAQPVRNVYFQIIRDDILIVAPVLIERAYFDDTSVHAINDVNATFNMAVSADIGYIELTDFTADSIESDMQSAIDAFFAEGKKKLILDLRGNGGGYGSILGQVASFFIKNSEGSGTTPVINHVYKNGGAHYTYTTGYKYLYSNKDFEYKVAVLVDGGTASASEALIGAMIGCGTCEIIGETTYGKGIGQVTENKNWTSMYAITVTTGYYYFFNDVSSYIENASGAIYCIDGKGFTPHSENLIAKGLSNNLSTDAQFARAVEYLDSLA